MTITDGTTIANNSAKDWRGGGVHNFDGTVTITGATTIANNSAGNDGGGVANEYGIMTITGGTAIANNSAKDWCKSGEVRERRGGGVYNLHGTVTITGATTIANNSAGHDGGGVANDHGIITITGGTTIANNSAEDWHGGGVYNLHGTMTITGATTIAKNSAVQFGGGVKNQWGTMTITGATTIAKNSAAKFGGGVHNSGSMTITGATTIANNSAEYGGGVDNMEGSNMTISGATIANNSATNGAGIHNNGPHETEDSRGNLTRFSAADLTISESWITDNVAYDVGGGLLNDGTTHLRGAIFAGNKAITSGDTFYNRGNLTLLLPLAAGYSSPGSLPFTCQQENCTTWTGWRGFDATPVPCAVQRCDFERYAGRTMITIATGETNDAFPPPCGSDAYYCTDDGSKQLVPLGYKGTGPAPELRNGYTECTDGEYCSKGVGTPCPIATYTSYTTSTPPEARASRDACERCPAKATSPEGSSGRSSCVCLKGYVPDESGGCVCSSGEEPVDGLCRPCGLGYFKTEPGDALCSPCTGANRVTLAPGAQTEDACVCPVGYAPDQSGNCVCDAGSPAADGSCKPCAPGFRKSDRGNAPCERCFPGFDCSGDGTALALEELLSKKIGGGCQTLRRKRTSAGRR